MTIIEVEDTWGHDDSAPLRWSHDLCWTLFAVSRDELLGQVIERAAEAGCGEAKLLIVNLISGVHGSASGLLVVDRLRRVETKESMNRYAHRLQTLLPLVGMTGQLLCRNDASINVSRQILNRLITLLGTMP